MNLAIRLAFLMYKLSTKTKVGIEFGTERSLTRSIRKLELQQLANPATEMGGRYCKTEKQGLEAGRMYY